MEMQGKAIIKPVDVWKNGDTAKDFPMQAIIHLLHPKS